MSILIFYWLKFIPVWVVVIHLRYLVVAELQRAALEAAVQEVVADGQVGRVVKPAAIAFSDREVGLFNMSIIGLSMLVYVVFCTYLQSNGVH